MSKGKTSKLGLVILIIFFIYFIYVAAGQQKTINSKNLELEKIQAKIDDEEKAKEELVKQKSMLNSDEYFEKIAREKLGMVKKGERVYVDIGK